MFGYSTTNIIKDRKVHQSGLTLACIFLQFFDQYDLSSKHYQTPKLNPLLQPKKKRCENSLISIWKMCRHTHFSLCVFCPSVYVWCAHSQNIHGFTAVLPAYTCRTIKSLVSVLVCRQCCVDPLLASSAVSVCYVCICDSIQCVLYSVLYLILL